MGGQNSRNKRSGLVHALYQVMSALSSAMDHRDPYTASHNHGVSALARNIAQMMGLDHEIVECVRVAGQLHDIGKISIPLDVLSKKDRLTAQEVELVRTHVTVGGDILKDVEFPWPVRDALLQHHERRDGSGYPYGLGKNDLLVEGQILAVADVVHAMMLPRPYREALGEDAALAEISRGRDTLFLPGAVDACIDIIRNRKEVLSDTFWQGARNS